ncbi:MAG: leucine-rich repeat protein [Paludibacteraceae bacterium]|nr:leucine-rich repeat protein [Paludibacteraceae bacterium]
MKPKFFTLTALTLSAGALFASDTAVGGIYYDFDDANLTATVTYRGSSCYEYADRYTGDVVIPATVTYGDNTYSVTSIGESAFDDCSGLISITIPNSVTSIGSFAFLDCSGLTSVTIPNSVTSIGWRAFDGCSGLTKTNYTGDIAGWCGINFGGWGSNPTAYSHHLYINDVEVKDLVIPNSVTSIGVSAFYGCSGLTSVIIPNSVTSIGEDAFAGCSGLTSVTIPNSVTSIGGWTFSNCSDLTSIVVESGNTTYDSRNGCNAIIETATNTLVVGCQSTIIPNSVTSIGDGAFEGCSGLTSVTIPNSVTSIGRYAFAGCSDLTSVTIGSSVTSIGRYAFAGCSDLTSVTIGSSVTSIGEEAFYGCSGLTSVTIGNSVTSIGEEAFYGCTKLINIVCYAAEPPSCDASVFANYNVFLKVPCNNLTAYQTHVCWGSFKYISCIGSEEVQVTEFSVTPSTNEAQFTWPAEPNAATYELVISKDGVVFCTLTFNASGQLMGIAFAPGANTAETTATSGFQFTVTGLDEASHYTYTFDAKDAGGSVVKHYAGEFNTDGSVGLEQIELAGLYTQAGRIVCDGEFRIYDLLGRDVTRLNGSLQGVYVVKTANAAVKVMVK